jgi:LEA14-like dessication related protein
MTNAILQRAAPKVHGLLPLMVLMMIALPGCATLQSGFETPTVTVTSFRVVQADSPGLNFEVILKVVNPNPDALKLRGVTYTISIEDRELITGVGNDLPTIDAYGEGLLTLTASMSMIETFQLLGDLMGSPRSSLRYELQTKLDIGALYPAIRVTDSGVIKLPQ